MELWLSLFSSLISEGEPLNQVWRGAPRLSWPVYILLSRTQLIELLRLAIEGHHRWSCDLPPSKILQIEIPRTDFEGYVRTSIGRISWSTLFVAPIVLRCTKSRKRTHLVKKRVQDHVNPSLDTHGFKRPMWTRRTVSEPWGTGFTYYTWQKEPCNLGSAKVWNCTQLLIRRIIAFFSRDCCNEKHLWRSSIWDVPSKKPFPCHVREVIVFWFSLSPHTTHILVDQQL